MYNVRLLHFDPKGTGKLNVITVDLDMCTFYDDYRYPTLVGESGSTYQLAPKYQNCHSIEELKIRLDMEGNHF